LFFIYFPALLAANNPQKEPERFMVHLLDYIAQDYQEAIQDGKVINPYEYDEMKEFAQSLIDRSLDIQVLKLDPKFQKDLRDLKQIIDEKRTLLEVSTLARSLQSQVIQQTHLEVTPAQWPNLSQGEKIYQARCTECHGPSGKGDGPLAQTLNPKPTNFFDLDRMEAASSLKLFNTIRLGIPETAMVAFSDLSDEDTWNIAFYVQSLRHRKDQENFKPVQPEEEALLKDVSLLSDVELTQKLKSSSKEFSVPALRLKTQQIASNRFIILALAHLSNAERYFKESKSQEASNEALLAYLNGVEPIEPKLKANDPALVDKLEVDFQAVRVALEKSEKEEDHVQAALTTARATLNEAQTALEAKHLSSSMTFFLTLGIILREALEALLVIISLLAVIRASGATEAQRWVHAGWMSAIFLGFLSWIFSGWLMAMSGAQREVLEGAVSLIAVLVLLYLGFWMHRQSHIHAWKKFIQERVQKALHGKNLIGLFILSFIAVFREVFETVLFLRAIWLETAGLAKMSMLMGVAASFVFVIVMAWVLLKFSKRLPLQKLFGLSSGVLIGLSLILTGKGFHALQETGLLSITQTPVSWRFDLLGVYPTVETLLPQLFVLSLCVTLWMLEKNRRTV
ncbi:MAG: cytochrome c/FTR1 family iron permease, partial [Deltaproteobacteria bacterium]|nr:cytochrome c/FTR1 family iron permease [Deltaproteobacteria bacterium]